SVGYLSFHEMRGCCPCSLQVRIALVWPCKGPFNLLRLFRRGEGRRRTCQEQQMLMELSILILAVSQACVCVSFASKVIYRMASQLLGWWAGYGKHDGNIVPVGRS